MSRSQISKSRSESADARTVGSLYKFVRDYLEQKDEQCTRSELLSAIEADADARQRLRKGRGFARLLQNMKHSGFVLVDGDRIIRTKRRFGHRRA